MHYINNYKKLDQTPLLLTVEKGDLAAVEALLDNNYDVNEQDTIGRSALFYAVGGNNIPMTKLLLERGADVSLLDVSQVSVLIVAVETGNYEMVQLILDKKPDINVQPTNKYPAIFTAVQENNLEIVELLLAYGGISNIIGQDEFLTGFSTKIARAVYAPGSEAMQQSEAIEKAIELYFDASRQPTIPVLK